MTFLTLENSAFDGKPLQLYAFTRTSGAFEFTWRYNSSDRDVYYLTDLYKAIPVSDGGSRFSSEALSTDLVVRMPVAEDFCQSYRLQGSIPSDAIFLRVRRVHAGDITAIDSAVPVVAEAPLVWMGTVSGMKQVDELAVDVTCAMQTTSLQRGGLRPSYQKTCPHVLYDPLTCKVDKAIFITSATITAISGLQVDAAEFALQVDGWFTGGFIEYTLVSGFTERRAITDHFGTAIHLMGFPAGLTVLDVISAFPGCNRTTGHCINKFDNLLNNGSFPLLPGRNPYDGLPVY